MKKLIAILAMVMLCSTAYAAQYGSRQLIDSSGLLSADTAVKATGGVVYGITGQAAAADVLLHICNGDVSDSETAASQLITIGAGADNAAINVSIPNGVYFDEGIYYNEKTGDATVTILYE